MWLVRPNMEMLLKRQSCELHNITQFMPFSSQRSQRNSSCLHCCHLCCPRGPLRESTSWHALLGRAWQGMVGHGRAHGPSVRLGSCPLVSDPGAEDLEGVKGTTSPATVMASWLPPSKVCSCESQREGGREGVKINMEKVYLRSPGPLSSTVQWR